MIIAITTALIAPIVVDKAKKHQVRREKEKALKEVILRKMRSQGK